MTATFNPQAAADQARDAYRNVTTQLGLLALDTAVPEAVRALDEKTVSQTREAYDRSKDALEASISIFERSFDAGWGAAAFNRKIIDIAQWNLNSCFNLATSLAGARNLAEPIGGSSSTRSRPKPRSPRAFDQGDGRRGQADQDSCDEQHE